ncbi:metal ABC transporter solute-binding protein, Zn/Mn family [Luteipulveratus mongoliensis]|uniref:ABC transporter substrate-binding protein n=1 Tax=Luteipulveratus mongoliensis TaxID=571913 RepID=A0A0K1JIM5_9MICO|nr:zinc ABC transporter substrate-binding protein [Luteipulveratus mongoliensis]AKU16574.1 hypothetical protein VV02_13070 [Luteipulveratus mongoliensis]
MSLRLGAAVATALLSTTALAACGSEGTGGSGGSGGSGSKGGQVDVIASFYPLQFAIQQIGGSHVNVSSLTKPGVEPHDLELTPKDVAKVSDAKLFVFEKGISGAVDQTAKNQASKTSYDVGPAAHLDLKLTSPVAEAHSTEGEHEDEAGATDPHFWLDPVRYQSVGNAIAAQLSKVDPEHKADYDAGAKAFGGKLNTLSGDLTTGLKSCSRKDVVTSHAAFGYLAARTGLTQVPIAGLSPESEPEGSQLASIATYAKAHHVTTIYTETLVSPAFADTVAKSTGATTAVLDPIEGVTDKSAGKDYFEIMRSNLAALKKGQGCS